jgi:hypothetical protein
MLLIEGAQRQVEEEQASLVSAESTRELGRYTWLHLTPTPRAERQTQQQYARVRHKEK